MPQHRLRLCRQALLVQANSNSNGNGNGAAADKREVCTCARKLQELT